MKTQNPINNDDSSLHPKGALARNTYEIKTLQDIWRLPTYEQMERCLEELSTAMLQARATNDMFAELVELDGKKLPGGRAFMWPESAEWIDDVKREISATYVGPDGATLMTMKTSQKPTPPVSAP